MSQAAQRRFILLVAVLTLVSGGVMMAAGYVADGEDWLAAGLVTIPAGLIIFTALALTRKAEADSRGGVPADRGWDISGPAIAVTLLSGGVMFLAGYALSAWWWGLAPVLAMTGGMLIVVAYAIDRRDVRTEQDAHSR